MNLMWNWLSRLMKRWSKPPVMELPHNEPPYFKESDISPLWEDESEDIYEDIKYTFGETYSTWWLGQPNLRFGGASPQEMIDAGKAYWVRAILRSIRTGAFT